LAQTKPRVFLFYEGFKMKPRVSGTILAFFIGCIFSGRLCFAETPHLRIVSLAPATTEVLFALGLNDEIVGVSRSCDYPPEALKKEKVGTFNQPNIEKILSLRPTVIFCTGLAQAPTVVKLRQLGLKVCVSDPSTFEGLFASIGQISDRTGKKEAGDTLVKSMKDRIEKFKIKNGALSPKGRPKVFLEFWHEPLMTAGAGSLLDEVIARAGGENLMHDMPRPYGVVSSEEIIRRNPDCIILTYMCKESGLSLMRGRLGWDGISAVKNKRVYNDIDPNLILRPGPRLVEGLEKIHERLYS
jgi:iron complex transport system substrate-binding protein